VTPWWVGRLCVPIANSKRVTVELDRGKIKQCATVVGRKVMCTDSEQQDGNCRIG
jgi:CMP-2-keto-3-deoxyoctulosonic acid synthetase